MDPHFYKEMYELEATYWWHRGKRFLVDQLLEKYLPENIEQGRLLIPGVGTGYLQGELQRKYGVIGMDFSPVSLSFCRKRDCRDLLCADLESGLPLRSDNFDAVLALDIIEHLEQEHIFLAESLRVLKAGGYLFVTVPAYDFLWSTWDEMANHKRRYRLRYLVKQMEMQGFEVVYRSYFNFISLFPAVFTRLIKRVTRSQASEFYALPNAVNNLATKVYELDIRTALRSRIPCGLSCVAVGRKSA